MSKYNLKTSKLPKSEVEIEAEISAEELEKGKRKALESFNTKLNIPGFRPGKIPENILLKHVGEVELLEEAAEMAINAHYSEILKELNLATIGRPQISLVKLAFGNPLLFKIKTAVLPEFKLPDYKKIAKEKMSSEAEVFEATDKEVEDVLLQLRKNKAHADWHKANPEEKDHSKHPDFEDEKNLPELTDEFAKLVSGFETLEELKMKVKENLVEDKKLKASEKKRTAIMEALIEKTEIDIPDLLVESEIEKMLAQIKDDVERIGGKFEDYLAHIKKTDADLRDDLRADAEKKAKIQLIFNGIAEAEKIVPDATILEHETKKILEYYPGAEESNARIYVATMLTNQEVLKVLEQQ